MYYCHTRFYNPLWRRWLTPDTPYYLNQESITGMNLFVYCNNNPVMYVDESGYFAITLGIGISIGAYELLVALGIVAAGAAATTIAITESEFHYIENGIKSFVSDDVKNVPEKTSMGVIVPLVSESRRNTYQRKKAAPRIKKKTKKESYQAAFKKGGKKKPIFHNGKYGPHFHPSNPKFKHWHYYFSLLYWYLLCMSEED